MASENAIAVAQEVIEKVRKGQRVKKGEIIRKHAYSESVSKSPTKVTKTKSYQKTIQPIVKPLEDEARRIMKTLKTKDLDVVAYEKLVQSLDTLIKNIQLLTGKETGRIMIDGINYIIPTQEKEN